MAAVLLQMLVSIYMLESQCHQSECRHQCLTFVPPNFRLEPFSMSEQVCSMGCLRDLQRKLGIDFLDVIFSEDKNPDFLVLES